MATRDVYGKYIWEKEKNKLVVEGIAKYKLLQYDPLDEQLIAFNNKIDEYTVLMDKTRVDSDNAADIQKIMIGIEKVLNTRQKIIEAIDKRGKRQKIEGDKEMSFLEQRYEASKN